MNTPEEVAIYLLQRIKAHEEADSSFVSTRISRAELALLLAEHQRLRDVIEDGPDQHDECYSCDEMEAEVERRLGGEAGETWFGAILDWGVAAGGSLDDLRLRLLDHPYMAERVRERALQHPPAP
jgi:hypothetical protein